MNWHIGQEVVCVKGDILLTKGNIYTIKGIRDGICPCSAVLLDVGVGKAGNMSYCPEHHIIEIKGAWYAECVFEPVADISELQSILNENHEQKENRI